MLRILLVEDNLVLLQNMVSYFEAKGYSVDCATNQTQGYHLANSYDFDVLVVDWMLPDGSGVALCEKLRQEGVTTHIVLLTAKGQLDDKLVGLRSGANDYLVKPIDMAELEARLLASQQNFRSELCMGPLLLGRHSKVLKRGNREVRLNSKCHAILWHLMLKAPNVVSREQLEFAIWGEEPPPSDALRAHIYTLRQAVDGQGEAELLHTVRGVGYRLELEAAGA